MYYIIYTYNIKGILISSIRRYLTVGLVPKCFNNDAQLELSNLYA